jgi:hypothetical protein
MRCQISRAVSGEIRTVDELIARADADPAFLHELLFDTPKAAEQVAEPELRGRLTGLDPRAVLTALIGRLIGPKGDVGKCGDTCGDNSCVDTCGDRSCNGTCGDDSCSGTCGDGSCDGTCKSSCGDTCGARSCVDTTQRQFIRGGGPGEGGVFSVDDVNRLRSDIDALIAQHLEPRQ